MNGTIEIDKNNDDHHNEKCSRELTFLGIIVDSQG